MTKLMAQAIVEELFLSFGIDSVRRMAITRNNLLFKSFLFIS